MSLSPCPLRLLLPRPAEVALPFDKLHSEVEALRQETEKLRAEGSVIAAPPSYTTGDV
jgi:hypothetical protein